MTKNILIVEDEFIVALNLRQILSDRGYNVVGIAPDAPTALQLAEMRPDIAFVDLNLRDGETGPEVGRQLGENYGTTTVFLTANASQLGHGVRGAIGVVSKPVDDHSIGNVIDYLVKQRMGEMATPPPSLRLFSIPLGHGEAAANAAL